MRQRLGILLTLGAAAAGCKSWCPEGGEVLEYEGVSADIVAEYAQLSGAPDQIDTDDEGLNLCNRVSDGASVYYDSEYPPVREDVQPSTGGSDGGGGTDGGVATGGAPASPQPAYTVYCLTSGGC